MTIHGSVWDEVKLLRLEYEANVDRLDGVLVELRNHIMALDERISSMDKPVKKAVAKKKDGGS